MNNDTNNPIDNNSLKSIDFKSLEQLEDAGIITLGRGKVISKKDIRDNPGTYPIYSSSATGDGVFGKYGSYMFDDTRITWSIDGGGKFFFRDAPKYSVTNVCGWLTVNKPQILDIRFLYFALMDEWSKKKYDYVHKAHPSVIRKEYTLPIPPINIQKKIAKTLDAFVNLEKLLEDELEGRQQQYDHYKNKLLSLDGPFKTESIVWSKLGEIAHFRRGSFPQPYGKREWYDGDGAMPFVQVADIGDDMKLVANTKRKISKIAQPLSVFAPKGSIIISLQGSIGRIAVTQYESYIDRTVAIFDNISENVDRKYFVYQLQRIFSIKEKNARGSTIKTITKEEFSDFSIPIPPIDMQKQIVGVLDNFDSLCNNTKTGLPAEIASRNSQYEFYRKKLLSFGR